MEHEQWLEMARTYALGSLEKDELKDFESHLASGCPLCQSSIRETEELLAALAASLEPKTPPAHVKTKLLQQIARNKAFPVLQPAVTGVIAALILLAVLALTFLGREMLQKTPLHDPVMKEILASPGVRFVELKGTGGYANVKGGIHWNPKDCRGCLMMEGLPKLEKGKVFQLWAAVDGGPPAPIGIFRADSKGRTHADFPALSERKDYREFFITTESFGEAASPTAPIRLTGRLPLAL